jgi:hypothetical protein
MPSRLLAHAESLACAELRAPSRSVCVRVCACVCVCVRVCVYACVRDSTDRLFLHLFAYTCAALRRHADVCRCDLQ